MKDKHYYITTPIYYCTARPHLGTLYSTIIADVIARWQKLHAKAVLFLTGTDEHGQKIAQTAEKAGLKPKELVDQFVVDYKRTWHRYHIEYDRFIRTTDVNHIQAVQYWLKQLIQSGDIYKGVYEGWYCTPCETFILQDQTETKPVVCNDCSRTTSWLSEETYFFKLSKYQQALLDFYQSHPDFIVPKERYAEVIRFVESGLRDLSISRSTITWGVPFPGERNKHVTYVWADALNNYITAIGYGDPNRTTELHQWWPANVQVMGKDIVRFHAVYWPAFLMAAGLQPPRRLLVHGWIRVGEDKMSKSKGNIIDPIALEETFGPEVVRYYLMRKMAITQDSPFTLADLKQSNNAELANDLGNLLNRVIKLSHKYGYSQIRPPKIWDQDATELRSQAWDTVETMQAYMESFEIHMALATLWKFINKANAYLHTQTPWKIAKTDPKKFEGIMSAVCHALHTMAVLAWPVLPKKMELLLASIGHRIPMEHDSIEDLELAHWGKSFMLRESEPLFMKLETEDTIAKKTESAIETIKDSAYLTIDDLCKVRLQVGTILTCEPLLGSNKLLKLTIDVAEKKPRIILSGIAQHYQSDELIGMQGIFVTNLKPRKMAGAISEGMMLMATDSTGKPQIVQPLSPVKPGTLLR